MRIALVWDPCSRIPSSKCRSRLSGNKNPILIVGSPLGRPAFGAPGLGPFFLGGAGVVVFGFGMGSGWGDGWREEQGSSKTAFKIAQPLNIRPGQCQQGREQGNGKPRSSRCRWMRGSGAEQMAKLGVQRAEAFPSVVQSPSNAAGDQRLPPTEKGEQGAGDLHPECRESRDRSSGWEQRPADINHPGVQDVEAVRGGMAGREGNVVQKHGVWSHSFSTSAGQ